MRLKLFTALLILCLLFSAFTGCGTTKKTTPGKKDGITPEATIAYPIVDTGVVTFYSDKQIISAPNIGEPFYGQDATYVGNTPTYTDNGDGTVTDNVTGLMWQQDMGKKMTYADAMKYAEKCTLGGYDDWRVPTIKELYSLIQFTGECGGEVAGDELFIDTDYFKQPIGNTSIGEREIDAQTWSSTIYVGTTMNKAKTVFGVNFIDGRIKGYGYYKAKTVEENTAYFRLVRGNEEYGKNNFVDNGDGTITDLATGLMWQQSDSGRGMDWENALSYAETLNLAGYDDWRLPNVKELQSIVDYTRSPSTTNSAAIDPLFKVSTVEDINGNTNYPYFWSGTTHMTGKGTNKYTSAAYVAFGYAQGIMNDKLMDVHGAGCQRSDPKSGNTADYPKSHGPQGDIQNVFNYVRCVRSVDVFENKGNTANDKAETTTESFCFAIQADVHIDQATDLSVLNNTFANIVASNPEFIMDLGDSLMLGSLGSLGMTAQERAKYVKELYSVYGDIPVCLVNGNHDGENGFKATLQRTSQQLRNQYFPMPFAVSGNTATANYYAFEKENVLFVALDPYSYTTESSGFWNDTIGKEQYDWLEKTLSESDAKYKLVFIHNIVGGINAERRGGIAAAPYFEWGGNSLNGKDEFKTYRPDFTMPIHDLLVKYGVDIVFHGHDHFYAREELDGIQYILVPQPGTIRQKVATAGEKGYTGDVILPSAGFLYVEVNENSVLVEYRKTLKDGGYTVADNMTLKK